jgi:hypothetical protein
MMDDSGDQSRVINFQGTGTICELDSTHVASIEHMESPENTMAPPQNQHLRGQNFLAIEIPRATFDALSEYWC